MSREKRKPRGGNSPVIGDNGVSPLPAGTNAKIAQSILTIMQWGPIDTSNIQELEGRLQQYIDYCVQNDVKISNMGCYFALGISKKTAYDWENGNSRGAEHCAFIKKVKAICGYYREYLMHSGRLNPITGIFWQKNYDGLSDTSEVILTPGGQLGDILTHDEIAAKYLEE